MARCPITVIRGSL